MNMLLATFWDNYGLIVILIAIAVAMMIFYHIKHRKQEHDIEEFENSLKIGDRVKTYSGFYGEILGITLIKENGNQVKIVSLKLGNNSYLEVDIRAIAQIDKREVSKDEQTLANKVEELRKKEDLAKRDQTKANAGQVKPTFAPKVEAKEPEKKVEQKPEVKKPEQVSEQKPEEKKFVPKKFERRSFSTHARMEKPEEKVEDKKNKK